MTLATNNSVALMQELIYSSFDVEIDTRCAFCLNVIEREREPLGSPSGCINNFVEVRDNNLDASRLRTIIYCGRDGHTARPARDLWDQRGY